MKKAKRSERKNRVASVATVSKSLGATTLTVGRPSATIAPRETFKEHYPLLPPYSYAAIVEDKKGELHYSVLEPTLAPVDELWIKELKSILWDELFINTKEFKEKKDAEELLNKKITETAKKYKIKL